MLWLLVVLANATSALAQTNQPNPVEVKLRESLRAALVQARDAETARARLQSEVEAKDAKIKELTDQLAAAHKRTDEDKLVAEQALALSNERFFREQKEAALLRESLAKWKASHAQAVALARAKETERAKLEPQVIELTRRSEDRERKNSELYQLGSEILERYENFAFGRALTAREPFTGLAKVKLEELVQGYKDKLADAKLTPVEAPPPPPVKAKPKRAQPRLR